jgi:FtsK/SpoIIIE family
MIALAVAVMVLLIMARGGVPPPLILIFTCLSIWCFGVRFAAGFTNINTKLYFVVWRFFGFEPKAKGVLAVATHRGFAMVERYDVWRGRGFFHTRHQHNNQRYLLAYMGEIGSAGWLRRRSLETYILAVLRQKAQRGRLSDLSGSPHRAIQLWTAAITCGIHGEKDITPLADLALSNFQTGSILYRLPHGTLQPKMFELHRTYFEQLLGAPVVIASTSPAGAVLVQRVPKLPPIIHYQDVASERQARGINHIALGVDLITAEPVFVEFSDMMHTQIAGVSGFGKSTFLQSLMQQCLELGDELAKIFVIDLKGTDFNYLVGNRLEVVFNYDKVADLVEYLVQEMEKRLAIMRAAGLRKWSQGRLLVVIDEFGQIMYRGVDPHGSAAEQKKGQAIQARLISSLCRLGMLGRAAGITLVCATQKPTADAIPTQLRANLDAAVMFRSSRLMASSIFGGDANLKFDPIDLPRGHAIAFLDGDVRYLKSYVV